MENTYANAMNCIVFLLSGRSIVNIVIDNTVSRWTVNETSSIYISMADSDSALTLYLERVFTTPETALVRNNATVWMFTWTPTDLHEVNFTYVGFTTE